MNEVQDLPFVDDQGGNKVSFNTGIITYPSDYDGLLTLEMIMLKFGKFVNSHKKIGIKFVVAKEEPDEHIQRIHYHCYIDADKQLSISPNKTLDIVLPEPVVVIEHEDTTRHYRLLNDIMSELGADNDKEMASRMATYIKDNNYKSWDIISKAHPNIQVKSRKFGNKYLMLRYVLKQKLIQSPHDDIMKELKWITNNDTKEQLELKKKELIENEHMNEMVVDSIIELRQLTKDYIKKL